MAAKRILPAGLTFGEVARKPRWVHICQALADGPPFRVKLRFLPVHRHGEIFEDATLARMRRSPEAEAEQMRAEKTYLQEYIEDWEGLTIPNYNFLVFSEDLMIKLEGDSDFDPLHDTIDFRDPETKEPNIDLAHIILTNAPNDRFQAILAREMTRFNEELTEALKSGKAS
jgi:hypothetical protein